MSQSQKPGFSGMSPNGGGPGKQPGKNNNKSGNQQSANPEQKGLPKPKPPLLLPRLPREFLKNVRFPCVVPRSEDGMPTPELHRLARLRSEIKKLEPPVRKKDLDGPLALSDRIWVDGQCYIPPMPSTPRLIGRRPMTRERLYSEKWLIPWAIKHGHKYGVDLLAPFTVMDDNEPLPLSKVKKPKKKVTPQKRTVTSKKCLPKPKPPPPTRSTNFFDCYDENEEELEEEVDRHFDFDTMLQELRRQLMAEQSRKIDKANRMDERDFIQDRNNNLHNKQTTQSRDERVAGPSRLANNRNKPRALYLPNLSKELTKPACVGRRQSNRPNEQECWASSSREPAVIPSIPEDGGSRFRPKGIRDPNAFLNAMSKNIERNSRSRNRSIPPRRKLKPAIKTSPSNSPRASELSMTRSSPSPSPTVSSLDLSGTDTEESEDITRPEPNTLPPQLVDTEVPPAEMEGSLWQTLQEICALIENCNPMSSELMAALENAENGEFNMDEWKALQDKARSILQGNTLPQNIPGQVDEFWDPNAESETSDEECDEEEEYDNDPQPGTSSSFGQNKRERNHSAPSLKQFARILKIVKLSGMSQPSPEDVQENGADVVPRDNSQNEADENHNDYPSGDSQP